MNTLLHDFSKKITFRISTQFGGKKGFIHYWFYKGIYCFRKRDAFVDFNQVKRLIFVCSGNICRSPFAEFYAKSKGLESLSYGLDVTQGRMADKDAVNTAKIRNIDLSTHTSANISDYIYQEGDVLFGFEPKHVTRLKKLSIHDGATILLLGQFHSPKVPYIQDPFMLHPLYFEHCFAIIERSIDTIQQLTEGVCHG